MHNDIIEVKTPGKVANLIQEVPKTAYKLRLYHLNYLEAYEYSLFYAKSAHYHAKLYILKIAPSKSALARQIPPSPSA